MVAVVCIVFSLVSSFDFAASCCQLFNLYSLLILVIVHMQLVLASSCFFGEMFVCFSCFMVVACLFLLWLMVGVVYTFLWILSCDFVASSWFLLFLLACFLCSWSGWWVLFFILIPGFFVFVSGVFLAVAVVVSLLFHCWHGWQLLSFICLFFLAFVLAFLHYSSCSFFCCFCLSLIIVVHDRLRCSTSPQFSEIQENWSFSGHLTTPFFNKMYTGFGDIVLPLELVKTITKCPTKNYSGHNILMKWKRDNILVILQIWPKENHDWAKRPTIYSDVTKKVGDIAISLLLARGVYYLAFVSKIYSYSKMCFPGVGYSYYCSKECNSFPPSESVWPSTMTRASIILLLLSTTQNNSTVEVVFTHVSCLGGTMSTLSSFCSSLLPLTSFKRTEPWHWRSWPNVHVRSARWVRSSKKYPNKLF